MPYYAQLVQHWASHVVADLQQRLGPDAVNAKLRDLVSSQAGTMLSFLASTLIGLITGGFALFNVLTMAIVTPVVAFYLLRDWPRMVVMVDGWLPLRATRDGSAPRRARSTASCPPGCAARRCAA